MGTGPLPITISQLEEKPAIDSQQSTTKCHICDTNFKDLDTLFLHKSLHVNPKVIYKGALTTKPLEEREFQFTHVLFSVEHSLLGNKIVRNFSFSYTYKFFGGD